MEFKFRNVDQAFKELVTGIYTGQIPTVTEDSRHGKVLRVPEPVTICYERPWERVLFNPARDCNPFFHLYEAMWMLAGRNDVESVAYYASNMRNYSDDGETLNGAYGYRWRQGVPGCGVDQLQELVKHLRANPDSRRAVLQMWNVEDDLLKIGSRAGQTPAHHTQTYAALHRDLVEYSKDVCCNLSVMFSLREIVEKQPGVSGLEGNLRCRVLDMTVTNRSNDLIWGTLGANVVHFSFLQEYMACSLGVGVGRYYQFTNNLHVYESNWEPDKWTSVYEGRTMHSPPIDYGDWVTTSVPLLENQKRFDREVVGLTGGDYTGFDEPFLHKVVRPMLFAFQNHKRRDYERALQWIDLVQADDWRCAGRVWLEKRKHNWEAKNA